MQVLDQLANHARLRGDETALHTIDHDGMSGDEWTWSQLKARVNDVSAIFKRRGISATQTVAIRSVNCPELVTWLFGGLQAGVRVCLLQGQLTDFEVRTIAQRCGVSTIVSDSKGLTEFEHLDLHFPILGEVGNVCDNWSADGGVVLPSSGTTGLPKLALRDGPALDADGVNLATALSLNQGDGVLAAVPLAHSYGVDLMMASMMAGASLHICAGGFSGSAVAKYLRRGAVTIVPGVPLMFAGLLREVRSRPQHVRLIFSAGSPFPHRMGLEVERQWGLRMGHLYGATELGTVAFGHPEELSFDERSVGRPLDGVAFRIVDPSDTSRVLPTGSEGELAVRAPSMLSAYVGSELELADGFFLTGDLARLDESGRLYLTGRLKHLIDVGSLKVNPAEVETVFLTHPRISDCAVAPLVLSDLVTKLRLLYVPHPDNGPVEIDELRRFAREVLASYKRPRVFEAVQQLPRSASGKLLRDML